MLNRTLTYSKHLFRILFFIVITLAFSTFVLACNPGVKTGADAGAFDGVWEITSNPNLYYRVTIDKRNVTIKYIPSDEPSSYKNTLTNNGDLAIIHTKPTVSLVETVTASLDPTKETSASYIDSRSVTLQGIIKKK